LEKVKIKGNFNGSGQECPLYTHKFLRTPPALRDFSSQVSAQKTGANLGHRAENEK
jgi:hypothetical protein